MAKESISCVSNGTVRRDLPGEDGLERSGGMLVFVGSDKGCRHRPRTTPSISLLCLAMFMAQVGGLLRNGQGLDRSWMSTLIREE